MEQPFTEGKGGAVIRPFSTTAQVHCRGYSFPLQRVITDFGADVPFGRVAQKLRDHHGIEVPITSAQAMTQAQAQKVHQNQVPQSDIPAPAKVKQWIVQMDGTLIPIVETTPGIDKEGNPTEPRTTPQTRFKEARLALSRSAEELHPRFGASFATVEDAGDPLLDCAIQVWGPTRRCTQSGMVPLGLRIKSMPCSLSQPPIGSTFTI